MMTYLLVRREGEDVTELVGPFDSPELAIAAIDDYTRLGFHATRTMTAESPPLKYRAARNRKTLDELNETLKSLETLKIMDTRSKTRSGIYLKTQKGLASGTYFVGFAHDESKVIVEDVS